MAGVSADAEVPSGARTPRQFRRAGFIPAILYGQGVEPLPLAVKAKEFVGLLGHASSSTLVTLQIGGGEPRRVLIHEVQHDPLTGQPRHVDFHQVRLTEKIRVKVPLKPVNAAPAVKDLGGVFIQSLNEIEVEAFPEDLPSEMVVDLSRLRSFEDRITVADLAVPATVAVHTAGSEMVAVVTPPRTEEELKQLETPAEAASVAEIKTEAEEKKAQEAAKKVAEEKTAGSKEEKKGK